MNLIIYNSCQPHKQRKQIYYSFIVLINVELLKYNVPFSLDICSALLGTIIPLFVQQYDELIISLGGITLAIMVPLNATNFKRVHRNLEESWGT